MRKNIERTGNYLSLQCITLQFFSVLASPSVWEVRGLIPGLFKLDTVDNVSPPWFEVALARRLATEMRKTFLRFLMTLECRYN